MDREQGNLVSTAPLDSFGKRTGYQHLGFVALLGMMYGIVVASVLSTSPTAITVAEVRRSGLRRRGHRCRCLVRLLLQHLEPLHGWSACSAGSSAARSSGGGNTARVAGDGHSSGQWLGLPLDGWWDRFSTARGGEKLRWIGAGVGAVIQAGWADPATVVQAGALGGVVGALAGPAFLLTCMGLGYVVLRRIGPPRHPFDG